MEVAVKNLQGQEVKKITLPDAVFGVDMNEHVLHTVVKGYLANRRQGTHATKTRTFVSGGGKKPFKQKGTGNARQGSSNSPVNPGGGISHGPQPRDYTQRMSKSLKRVALCVALSDKARHNKLVIINDFSLSAYSTKHVSAAIKALKIQRPLFADERKDDFLYKSARNIHGANALGTMDLNAEAVLRHDYLVISESSVKLLNQRLTKVGEKA